MLAKYSFMRSLLLIVHLSATANAQQIDSNGSRTGRLDVTHTAAELVDSQTFDSMADVLALDERINWKMYVPNNYDPSKPAGLFVYISPTPRGWMPRGWQTVFDEENLIWISADSSGNETHTKKRMFFAVLAPEIAAKRYQIDPDGVYLSGFSGGGKVAAVVAIHFANLFRGAIYIGGAQKWTNVDPDMLSAARLNRYVFVTGTRDFNLALTKKIYRQYAQVGIDQTKLVNIPGMGHTTPNAEYFRQSLKFLDQRP